MSDPLSSPTPTTREAAIEAGARAIVDDLYPAIAWSLLSERTQDRYRSQARKAYDVFAAALAVPAGKAEASKSWRFTINEIRNMAEEFPDRYDFMRYLDEIADRNIASALAGKAEAPDETVDGLISDEAIEAVAGTLRAMLDGLVDALGDQFYLATARAALTAALSVAAPLAGKAVQGEDDDAQQIIETSPGGIGFARREWADLTVEQIINRMGSLSSAAINRIIAAGNETTRVRFEDGVFE